MILEHNIKIHMVEKQNLNVSVKIADELKLGQGLSIINLVDFLIEQANELRSSDIHIDPLGDAVRIRFRIDGVLQDVHALPKNIHAEIISRIKILSGLRTDEHRAAQDGRFRKITKDKYQ